MVLRERMKVTCSQFAARIGADLEIGTCDGFASRRYDGAVNVCVGAVKWANFNLSAVAADKSYNASVKASRFRMDIVHSLKKGWKRSACWRRAISHRR